jgi:hypoxanthine phosphoribosyltransferase
MTTENLEQLREARARAELLVPAAEVEARMDAMAQALTERLGAEHPLLLGVMVGGVVPLGMLLRRLDFALEVDYVHATRYRGATRGAELHWLRAPPEAVRDRSVLVVDDVLDEGLTLEAIVQACREAGAREVLTAVAVTKTLSARPGLAQADFSAIEAADRYLFGCGMDYRGHWRNAAGIYALNTD